MNRNGRIVAGRSGPSLYDHCQFRGHFGIGWVSLKPRSSLIRIGFEVEHLKLTLNQSVTFVVAKLTSPTSELMSPILSLIFK